MSKTLYHRISVGGYLTRRQAEELLAALQKDETIGAQWLMVAARQGNPVAQNRLARIYALGRGVEADPVEAAKWHVLASEAGRTDAELDTFADDALVETVVVAAKRIPVVRTQKAREAGAVVTGAFDRPDTRAARVARIISVRACGKENNCG